MGERKLAFFSIGDHYRGTYQIEYVEPFFEGELAVASSEGERFFLQLTRLQKPAPPRAIQQYLSLKDHPLIVPYLQVYSEERSLVMIRPYVPFTERLHERIARGGLDEDQILDWVSRLFPVEEVLKEKPLRMYTVLHPANIGLTESGQVQVLYCGVEGRTLPDPRVDWGNLLYMLFSGNMLDQPIKKLPPDHGFSKPLEKLIQRSFHRQAGSVASNLETYLKKRDAKGFFDFLKTKTSPKEDSSEETSSSVESPSDSAVSEDPFPPEGPSSDILRRRLEETRRAKEEAERRAQEEAARQEQERLEREQREREEAERRAQEEAARQEQERLERERREREEAERREREEAARQEQERLEQERQERKEAERRAQEEAARQEQERLEQERREREEAERRAQEEAARQEQERLEQERREREEAERRAQEEAARQEQERLEQERREREEAERRAQEEAARQEQERLEQERREREEAERRAQEEAARQEQGAEGHEKQLERARAERLHHDRLAAQFEEYVRQVFNRQSSGND